MPKSLFATAAMLAICAALAVGVGFVVAESSSLLGAVAAKLNWITSGAGQ